MCGRFSLGMDGEEVARLYHSDLIASWQPQYSIAPSTIVPALHQEGARRILAPVRWGFWPNWAKGSGPHPINARLETVATNGLFRAAMASMRCVVPMTGYFEWTGERGNKIPHHIHGSGLLSAAAIATTRKIDAGFETTMAIITVTARDSAGQVHDRMPVFLANDDLGEWLNPARLDATQARGLAAYIGKAHTKIAHELTVDQVDRGINSVRRIDPADPHLIEPVA
ncbi:SOS response-associated peptidase [Cutibacterium sp.]|uniref:SOS response-associated peptidase n=1 Tax=Cutibacterium sp. TaxID=1912221 RepID=UPI0026DDAEA4|nr:SOS response-associated peptidase [Cutibacterium sp.]MDO4412500.1 SOS response-associated peptidase [Cutibacterium sp.]